MQPGNLGSHLDSQFGVQVGERFVHQEDLRVPDDGTAHGDTLSLTTGELARFSLEQLVEVQDAGGLTDGLVDFIFRCLSHFETERHVVINGHVRIQCVVLENHRDVTVFRFEVVDDLVTDLQGAAGDVFQTGDHTKCGRLTTAGRTDKDDEFLIGDLQVEVFDRFIPIRIFFADVFQG